MPTDPLRPHDSPWPLASPGKVIADERGALWIADTGHHRVLGAHPPDAGAGPGVANRAGQGEQHHTVHTAVGTGRPGAADGPLAEASFVAPQGLALTAGGEVLYVADAGAHTVRRVDLAAGTVTTVAGTGQPGALPVPGGPGPARDTALHTPWDLALDEERGCLYIAAAGSHQIARLDLRAGVLGVLHVLADTRTRAGGPGPEAAFARPSGLALSPDRKRLYVADSDASAVRVIHLADHGPEHQPKHQEALRVETLTGTWPPSAGHVDGPPDRARLHRCIGLTLGPAGLVVADTHNHALRGINLRHGTVITLWQGQDQGNEKPDRLREPGGVAFDRVARGYIVADTGNHRLMRVARDASAATELVLGDPS